MATKIVGIVNFNKSMSKKLIQTIVDLKYKVLVIDATENYVQIIKDLYTIDYWILYGDDYHLYNNKNRLNMSIFELNKHFLLYGYAMKCFLIHKGFEPSEDGKVHNGEIKVKNNTNALFEDIPKNMNVYRKYKYYFSDLDNSNLKILATYKNVFMTGFYKEKGKNVLLIQWKPENTKNGVIFLNNWLCS